MKLEINKVFQGDCFDLINKIDDESVDLIVCDGPYGVTMNGWDKVGNIQEYNLSLIKKGKNPGDVWGDIKQLTYKSKELLNKDFLHTIQKPIKLLERIIKANSNERDLILDPFMGTGTTAVVCKNLKRNFVGFENDPKMIEICENRLRDIQSKQASIFAVNDYVGIERQSNFGDYKPYKKSSNGVNICSSKLKTASRAVF